MARDKDFYLGFEDVVLCVRWGEKRLPSLPCWIDPNEFGLEVSLEAFQDEKGYPSGFKIGVTIVINKDRDGMADIVRDRFGMMIDECLRRETVIGVEAIPVECESFPGLFIFSWGVVVPVEFLDDAFPSLRQYARFLYDEMKELGWIQPQEGGE